MGGGTSGRTAFEGSSASSHRGLVERLGRAASLLDRRGAGLRRTRHAGLGAGARGGARARGRLGRRRRPSSAACCRRPAVALLALDLGVVITASHNPPEYNGVKFFDASGHKLSDATEEQIEALLDCGARRPTRAPSSASTIAADAYVEYVLDHFGADLSGLELVVDCANGAYSGLAAGGLRAARRTRSTRSATRPTARTSTSAAAPPTPRCCERTVVERLRPRDRLRRRRRPHARGRRARRAGRRRPDPRDPRARPRRRARRRHADDEPRLRTR